VSFELDKTAWKRVSLGNVAAASKERVDPISDEIDRYIAGEHMDTDDLKIHRWGEVGNGYLGPAFHRRFHPGQILYGSRRTYLRKVAVAEFSGVTANTTFVVETKESSVLLQEFLPFVMSSEPFHSFAVQESKGSVNPYVNWSDIARYEFDLPPLGEQKLIANLFWSVERHRQAIAAEINKGVALRVAHLHDRMSDIASNAGTVSLDSLIEPGRPITYGILMPGSSVEGGVPVVKVRDFPDGRIHEEDLLLTSPEIAHDYRRSTLKSGDLLISIRGTVGRLAEVPESLEGANITQDTARLSIAPEHNRRYVRLALASEFVQSQIRRQITGLAVKGINLGALREIAIPIPADHTAEERLVNESESILGSIASLEASRAAASDLGNALSVEIFRGAQ
jgi:type I restriction enzyme S subunit